MKRCPGRCRSRGGRRWADRGEKDKDVDVEVLSAVEVGLDRVNAERCHITDERTCTLALFTPTL